MVMKIVVNWRITLGNGYLTNTFVLVCLSECSTNEVHKSKAKYEAEMKSIASMAVTFLYMNRFKHICCLIIQLCKSALTFQWSPHPFPHTQSENPSEKKAGGCCRHQDRMTAFNSSSDLKCWHVRWSFMFGEKKSRKMQNRDCTMCVVEPLWTRISFLLFALLVTS